MPHGMRSCSIATYMPLAVRVEKGLFFVEDNALRLFFLREQAARFRSNRWAAIYQIDECSVTTPCPGLGIAQERQGQAIEARLRAICRGSKKAIFSQILLA